MKSGLSWILKGSSFDLVRLELDVVRSSRLDGTSPCSLYTRFSYFWDTGELFHCFEILAIVLRKLPGHGDDPLARRAFPARAVRFAVDRLLSMDETRARISGFDGARCSAPDVMDGGALHNEKLIPTLLMSLAMTGTLLMCLFILTLKLVPVFTDLSKPFTGYEI